MSDQPTQPPQQRLRITFGKIGSQKYVGHLDLAKTWERILRRADLGLSYSQGYNARPKMQLAAALPLGVTSECELLDIWLDHPSPIEGLAEHLSSVSPPGLPVHRIEEISLKAPPMQTLLESSSYVITPIELVDVEDLRRRVRDLMAQTRLIRTHRDRPYDLRPLIYTMIVNDEGQIRTEVVLSEQGTARTDELLDALGLRDVPMSVHRVQIKLRRA
jgi:radical SAM-linked protein